MPLDTAKIALAVRSGLCVVCATCENHWNAVDNGSLSCGRKCGGPMAGDVFHDYKGPMTDEAIAAFCFVCGNRSEYGIRVNDKRRVLGCCSVHVDLVKNLRPVDGASPNISVISKSAEKDIDKIKDKPITLKIRGGGDG